jgi:3-hydroxyisobutyrate dehydrogenase-like beta-hydroxyacid dehydrogenase
MVKSDYLPAQGTFEALSRYFVYIDALAEKAGASTPLFDLAASLYQSGIESGLAEHDVAAIKEVIAGQPRSSSTVKRVP